MGALIIDDPSAIVTPETALKNYRFKSDQIKPYHLDSYFSIWYYLYDSKWTNRWHTNGAWLVFIHQPMVGILCNLL